MGLLYGLNESTYIKPPAQVLELGSWMRESKELGGGERQSGRYPGEMTLLVRMIS